MSKYTRPEFVLTALRLTIAVVLLAPVYFRERSKHREAIKNLPLTRTLLPAVVLAFHLISQWSFGARLTAVAQSTLICVNLVPILTLFFTFWAAKEKINRAEILGTVLAVLGLMILTGRDAASSGSNLAGNIVCITINASLAAYLA